MSDGKCGEEKKGNDNCLYCTFCGKNQHEVRRLIAGPSVLICDACVELCNDIIHEELENTEIDSRRDARTLTTQELRAQREREAEKERKQELRAQREREAEKERMDHELAKLKSELERLKIEKEIADLKRQRVLEKKSIR